jgi:hypothetical protein
MRNEMLDAIKRLREEIAAAERLNEAHENHSPHYSHIANREYRARKRRVAEITQELSELLAEKEDSVQDPPHR